jgi:hypothetical protein
LEIHVDEMETSEAERLFTVVARKRSPKWSAKLSQEDLDCLNEISHTLRGHPREFLAGDPGDSSHVLRSLPGLFSALQFICIGFKRIYDLLPPPGSSMNTSSRPR